MPIYGYRCEKCGNELEVLQSMSAARLTECPKCGGRLHKKLYPAGVIFKGSGFYKTDYASPSKGSSNSGDGSSDSKTDSKTDSKVDSKNDSKSDSKSDSSSSSTSSSSSDGPKAAAS